MTHKINLIRGGGGSISFWSTVTRRRLRIGDTPDGELIHSGPRRSYKISILTPQIVDLSSLAVYLHPGGYEANMRITARQLRQIIKEEVENMMNEEDALDAATNQIMDREKAARGVKAPTKVDPLTGKTLTAVSRIAQGTLPYYDAANDVAYNAKLLDDKINELTSSSAKIDRNRLANFLLQTPGESELMFKKMKRIFNTPETGGTRVADASGRLPMSASTKFGYWLTYMIAGSRAVDPTQTFTDYGSKAGDAMAQNAKLCGFKASLGSLVGATESGTGAFDVLLKDSTVASLMDDLRALFAAPEIPKR